MKGQEKHKLEMGVCVCVCAGISQVLEETWVKGVLKARGPLLKVAFPFLIALEAFLQEGDPRSEQD